MQDVRALETEQPRTTHSEDSMWRKDILTDNHTAHCTEPSQGTPSALLRGDFQGPWVLSAPPKPDLQFTEDHRKLLLTKKMTHMSQAGSCKPPKGGVIISVLSMEEMKA